MPTPDGDESYGLTDPRRRWNRPGQTPRREESLGGRACKERNNQRRTTTPRRAAGVRVNVQVPTKSPTSADLLTKYAESRASRCDRAGPVFAHQIRLLVNPVLRGSAAHVFVESLATPELGADDEHHLRRVLRIRDSDVVTVSNGVGTWVTARLTAGGLVVDSEPTDVARPRPSVVISAIPKGDRPEWMVQKLTEMGATAIGFMDCARSVVRWDPARANRQLDRLRRIAREAAMQSRRIWLPELLDVGPFDEVIKSISCAIADPEGTSMPPDIDAILVGPEVDH